MKAAGPWSISRQLILWFTVTAAGVLLSGLALVYGTVVQHADADDANYMQDRMVVIGADIAEEFPDPKWLSQELASFHDGSEPPRHQLRVLDAERRILAESEGMSQNLPLSRFGELGASVAARPPSIEYRSPEGHWYMLTSAWVGPADAQGHRWAIQLSMDRNDEKLFRQQFAGVLLAVLICGVGVTAAISRFVVRRGLAPVKEMEATMARVRATRLSERVSGHDWPRELGGLASSFDEMLVRLEESFTQISRFSADVAHDLRTPLFNMRGETEVALARTRTAAEYRDVLESGLEELSRLAQMIDSLLFLARAENPERRIARTVFEGRRESVAIVELHEAAAEERQVQLAVEGEAPLFADVMLFRRVLSNLLSNALQHTPSGGRVIVMLRQLAGDAAEMTVADSGSGIGPEHLPRVFDRLYRADQSRHSEGSGLGLAIVKSIMQLHGGTILVASEPGRGTTVRLQFPPPGGEEGGPFAPET